MNLKKILPTFDLKITVFDRQLTGGANIGKPKQESENCKYIDFTWNNDFVKCAMAYHLNGVQHHILSSCYLAWLWNWMRIWIHKVPTKRKPNWPIEFARICQTLNWEWKKVEWILTPLGNSFDVSGGTLGKFSLRVNSIWMVCREGGR